MRPTLVLLVSLAALGGCSSSEPAEPPAGSGSTALAAPAPVMIDPARTDLVFRYLDPTSGEVATATALDAIPETARREVAVFDPAASLPAGWDLVADLSVAPAVAVPYRSFSFTTRAQLTPSEARPPAPASSDKQHEVVMFSTAGCGYCTKARKFMTKNRIPFTELDVEDNPAAPARLSALGQRAGLAPNQLQGVPIIFVDGKPILGWDQKRLTQLLGI